MSNGGKGRPLYRYYDDDNQGEWWEIPTEATFIYLGTTIAFNKEDDAKHGKHVLGSMKEYIKLIGKSRLNITKELQAIKALELPRIDFRMMCAGIYQSDLKEFDGWLRGQINGWPGMRGTPIEVFMMSWRDGQCTLPWLQERQHTMVIR
jgi:hypothetical protein